MTNFICLQGRIARIGETKALKSGTLMLEFAMAVTKPKWKCKPDDDAYFFNVVLFSNQAEWFTANIGDLVMVSGELAMDEWKDKDGKKRYRLEIIGNSVVFRDKNSVPKHVPNVNAGAGQRVDQDPF